MDEAFAVSKSPGLRYETWGTLSVDKFEIRATQPGTLRVGRNESCNMVVLLNQGSLDLPGDPDEAVF
jgi:hypothetical protein